MILSIELPVQLFISTVAKKFKISQTDLTLKTCETIQYTQHNKSVETGDD